MFTGESNHAFADVAALPADPIDTPLSMCILAINGLYSSNSTFLSSTNRDEPHSQNGACRGVPARPISDTHPSIEVYPARPIMGWGRHLYRCVRDVVERGIALGWSNADLRFEPECSESDFPGANQQNRPYSRDCWLARPPLLTITVVHFDTGPTTGRTNAADSDATKCCWGSATSESTTRGRRPGSASGSRRFPRRGTHRRGPPR